MNGGNVKERGPMQLAGKEFVIVIVIVFSSLSFTLGFFVGKKSGGNNAAGTSQFVTLPKAPDQTRQNAAAQEIPPAAVEVTPRDIPQTRPTGEDNQFTTQSEPTSPEKTGTDGKARPAQDAAAKGPVEEIKKEKTALPETRRTAPATGGAVFSVQLGALKSLAEAKGLKDKYAREGYSTYITVVSGKKKEKIYKVKAGKFRERKDAELLSIKLKKSGAVHAFVTSRNE
ncbi:MAG: SPOR domain-containing protein [Acidobacteriota bacterium]